MALDSDLITLNVNSVVSGHGNAHLKIGKSGEEGFVEVYNSFGDPVDGQANKAFMRTTLLNSNNSLTKKKVDEHFPSNAAVNGKIFPVYIDKSNVYLNAIKPSTRIEKSATTNGAVKTMIHVKRKNHTQNKIDIPQVFQNHIIGV